MPIKVGIIGYGFAAKSFHLPFINALSHQYQVIAILQRAEAPKDPASVEKGTHCTVDFPTIKHYTTADAFFADSEIEFVVVASHTDTHIEFAKRALEARKHVIVDKPFARSTEEADGAIELAREKGKVLTAFQNRRWASATISR
jgi:predicted dehydrogenase